MCEMLNVDVYIYSIILCFFDCHVDINIYMYYFIVLVIFSVCVKRFNIDVCIYSTLLLLPFFMFLFVSSWFFLSF